MTLSSPQSATRITRWFRDFRTAWRLGITVGQLREFQRRWIAFEVSRGISSKADWPDFYAGEHGEAKP